MVPVEIGQIRIRYLEQGDADAYIAQERDSILKKFMGGPTARSDVDLRGMLNGYIPSLNFTAIADSVTNHYIGRCGYLNTDSPDTKELYVLLGHDWQRSGRGKVVMQFLVELVSSHGHSSVAYVAPENTRSIRMLDSLSWKNAGKLETKNY